MKYVAVLGRQAGLSVAELESVFGDYYILPVSGQAVAIASDNILDLAPRLGGTVKITKVLTEISSKNWGDLENYLKKNVPLYLGYLPEGKLTFGISTYDISVTPARINATALSLKKIIKNAGKSVRIVPNKENALNSAKVLYNKLTGDKGWELVFIGTDKGSTILAQTVYEQDIDAYAGRDQQRPARDARVGMLPPKLAQTIINLSGAKSEQTLLDPFCGTGVLLQEALLMDMNVVGADLEPKMIEYSGKNMDWLAAKTDITNKMSLKVADATSATIDTNVDVIACETYLGRPLTSLPDQESLNKIVQDCNTIHKKFLQNIARQTKPGFKMCIAVPAWKLKAGFKHLPVLDHLEELGYNRIRFVHVDTKDLIYHRDDQVVARELVVLIRK